MNDHVIQSDPELQRILFACLTYWQNESLPPADREICHTWVCGTYQSRFGGTFHPSRLRRLAELGFLALSDTNARVRRYYTVPDPDHVRNLLQRCGLG